MWKQWHDETAGAAHWFEGWMALLAVNLSATGSIARWGWELWLLMAIQAATGILVVHTRLDAKIAAKIAAIVAQKNPAQAIAPAKKTSRRAAFAAVGALALIAVAAARMGRGWLALALLVASAG